MTQKLLIRLFRSIEGEHNEDIIKVAQKIIDEEEQKGHTKLAAKLQSILEKKVDAYSTFQGGLKHILPKDISVPKDKRHNIPLLCPLTDVICDVK